MVCYRWRRLVGILRFYSRRGCRFWHFRIKLSVTGERIPVLLEHCLSFFKLNVLNSVTTGRSPLFPHFREIPG